MKPCGLVGRSLSHSYSPALHALLGAYEYRLFELVPQALSSFLQAGEFSGLNVTIPYKEAVLPLCHELSPRAAQIGSVNTILRRADGSLWGDNTDAEGFDWMLKRSGIAVSGRKVLVLGDGGAARAVRHVLAERGAESIITISRRGEDHYGTLHRHRDAEVIINTTPLGMYPNTGASAVALSQFPACRGVLDLIYNPARTRLMLEAQAREIPCAGGLSMLVGQARAAAALFSGAPVSDQRAEDALRHMARQSENLVLVGMPGCGKSRVGWAIAAATGREFVDTDHRIEEAAGCDITTLFRQEGERGFRLREQKLLAQLGRESGLVLATGGGCVMVEENEASLRQNARVVFLQRPLGQLAREGRPLSQAGDLEWMFAQREPLYRRFSDFTVENQGEPEAVAARIWEGFCEAFGD